MPGHLTVLELTDPRWGEFVARQPSATPFHHPDCGKLVATCYGFRAFAVATSDATGEMWVTLPFTDYCPPLVPASQEEADLVGARPGMRIPPPAKYVTAEESDACH